MHWVPILFTRVGPCSSTIVTMPPNTNSLDIARTKVLLHVLVSSFSFQLAVAKEDIVKGNGEIVMKPLVASEKGNGHQMPLLVTPVRLS